MLTTDESDVLYHLGYEWWMFRCTHDLLKALPTNGDPVRNALMESMAVHGRGLTYFFFLPKRFATDWGVSDLGRGLVVKGIPAILDVWRDETNKRVAHLTGARNPALSQWDAESARAEMADRIAHVKATFASDFPHDWIGDKPTTTMLITPPPTIALPSPTPITIGGTASNG